MKQKGSYLLEEYSWIEQLSCKYNTEHNIGDVLFMKDYKIIDILFFNQENQKQV